MGLRGPIWAQMCLATSYLSLQPTQTKHRSRSEEKKRKKNSPNPPKNASQSNGNRPRDDVYLLARSPQKPRSDHGADNAPTIPPRSADNMATIQPRSALGVVDKSSYFPTPRGQSLNVSLLFSIWVFSSKKRRRLYFQKGVKSNHTISHNGGLFLDRRCV